MFKEEKRERKLRWKRLWHLKLLHRDSQRVFTEIHRAEKKEEKKRRVTQEKVEMFKEEKRERKLRWKRLWHLKFLHGGAQRVFTEIHRAEKKRREKEKGYAGEGGDVQRRKKRKKIEMEAPVALKVFTRRCTEGFHGDTQSRKKRREKREEVQWDAGGIKVSTRREKEGFNRNSQSLKTPTSILDAQNSKLETDLGL